MKKLLLASILLFSSVTLFAQDANKAQRDQRRAERTAAYEAKLTAAIQNQNFTFVAQTMSPTFGGMVAITPPNNYVDVMPASLVFALPYASISDGPKQLSLTASDYEYGYNISDGRAYVRMVVKNVMNAQRLGLPQNYNYTIHLEIFMATGLANMTVVPNFSTAIQYYGALQFN